MGTVHARDIVHVIHGYSARSWHSACDIWIQCTLSVWYMGTVHARDIVHVIHGYSARSACDTWVQCTLMIECMWYSVVSRTELRNINFMYDKPLHNMCVRGRRMRTFCAHDCKNKVCARTQNQRFTPLKRISAGKAFQHRVTNTISQLDYACREQTVHALYRAICVSWPIQRIWEV
jgi:hypothetical protein